MIGKRDYCHEIDQIYQILVMMYNYQLLFII